MPVMEDQKYWTPKEVAKHYRVSEETVRRLIREKKLKAIRFGTSYRISEQALREFFEKQQQEDK